MKEIYLSFCQQVAAGMPVYMHVQLMNLTTALFYAGKHTGDFFLHSYVSWILCHRRYLQLFTGRRKQHPLSALSVLHEVERTGENVTGAIEERLT